MKMDFIPPRRGIGGWPICFERSYSSGLGGDRYVWLSHWTCCGFVSIFDSRLIPTRLCPSPYLGASPFGSVCTALPGTQLAIPRRGTSIDMFVPRIRCRLFRPVHGARAQFCQVVDSSRIASC